MMRSRVWYAAVAVFMLACSGSEAVAPREQDAPGLIVYFRDTTRISAPDTVNRGETFPVMFRSFAGDCTKAIVHTKSFVEGRTLRVQPIDRMQVGGVCNSQLLLLMHAAFFTLNESGAYTIKVEGAKRDMVTGVNNVPAVLTRQVYVR